MRGQQAVEPVLRTVLVHGPLPRARTNRSRPTRITPGEIRTPDRRIRNPLRSCRKDKSSNDVTESDPKSLAQTLAHELQNCPDLARVVAAWPALPAAIRAGILAMIEAAG